MFTDRLVLAPESFFESRRWRVSLAQHGRCPQLWDMVPEVVICPFVTCWQTSPIIIPFTLSHAPVILVSDAALAEVGTSSRGLQGPGRRSKSPGKPTSGVMGRCLRRCDGSSLQGSLCEILPSLSL